MASEVEVRKITPVFEQLFAIEAQTRDLSVLSNELEETFAPVLSPEERGEGMDQPAGNGNVVLDRLRSISTDLNVIKNRLKSIKDRSQV